MAAVRRSLGLRRLLSSPDLSAMAAGLRVLPALPRLFPEMLAELESETGSAHTLAGMVRSDVALTAQLLKLINSGYFGLPEAVTDVESAIQMLGFDSIRTLVLHSGVFGRFSGVSEISLVLERVSRRSLKTSELARCIAVAEGLPLATVQAAACASLLAHIGTVVLAANFPAGFQRAAREAERDGLGIDRVEHRLFQADHALLGAYLLGLWGFNDTIVEAVAYHHRPAASGSNSFDVIAITHIAQFLARAESRPGYLDTGFRRDIDHTYLAELGVVDRLDGWIGIFQTLRGLW